MLKSCKYCGRIHPSGYRCTKAPVRRKRRTDQTGIRSTHRWTRKSLEVRERDCFLCRMCLDEGIVNYEDIEVHHIISLEEDEGFAFENDWLISLCGRHHERAEAGEIDRERLHTLAGIPPTLPADCGGMRQDHKSQDGHDKLRK